MILNLGPVTFYWSVKKRAKIRTNSILSRNANGLHCLFIDYDHRSAETVRDDLATLQAQFNVCSFVVLQRPGQRFNWHVASLCEFPYHAIPTMLERTRCDAKYIRNPMNRVSPRGWNLALDAKMDCDEQRKPADAPVAITLLAPCTRPHSTALALFLERKYNIQIPKEGRIWDGSTIMEFERYPTRK